MPMGPIMRFRRYALLTFTVVAWTAAPAHAQWLITPYIGVNLSGDVEQGKAALADSGYGFLRGVVDFLLLRRGGGEAFTAITRGSSRGA